MTIFGDGTQTRAFTSVADVAPVMAEAIDEPRAWNEVFNVGSDEPCSLNDLAERVAAAMGVEPRIEYLPPRHEVHHAYSSHEKIARLFGRRETTPLDEGLRAMAAWVKARGARSSPAFGDIEIRKNLPKVWHQP
jgi:UDP-glucose 4-epimerase